MGERGEELRRISGFLPGGLRMVPNSLLFPFLESGQAWGPAGRTETV